jgi:trk system potassium uptake protein TrkA
MKSYGVIGLGKFGFHVAKGLAEQGLSVIACDHDAEKVRQVGDYVDDALIIDSTDITALSDAGLNKVDVVIVSIGEDIEASTMTVMSLIELGVPQVIAKAISVMHGKILTKLGAYKIIHPEREAAMRLVKNIADHITYDTIDLSNTMRIVKVSSPKVFVGRKLNEIDFEHSYKVKLIAHKYDDLWHTDINSDLVVHERDVLVLLGGVADIENLSIACNLKNHD